MSLLSQLLSPNDVHLDVSVSGKTDLFERAARAFASTHGLDVKTVNQCLNERERLGSTGLGEAVAIPHGRLKGLAKPLGCFLRLVPPIGFDAPDGKPVSDVFVLLVPEKATDAHLLILSELAEKFSDKGFRDQLRQSHDPGHVHRLLSAV